MVWLTTEADDQSSVSCAVMSTGVGFLLLDVGMEELGVQRQRIGLRKLIMHGLCIVAEPPRAIDQCLLLAEKTTFSAVTRTCSVELGVD